jgi:hypothetical protein
MEIRDGIYKTITYIFFSRPRGRWAASVRTRFLLRPRTVKTRPRRKRGRARTSGRKGRLDGNFPPISSFMTSLAETPF